jgi:hypothetical protein
MKFEAANSVWNVQTKFLDDLDAAIFLSSCTVSVAKVIL